MRILATIAARQYADLLTVRSHCSRNPLDERRLTSSAGSDVADTDDRSIEFCSVKGPTTIQRQARTRDCAVQ